jgi:chromosome segregation ATPase
LASELEESRKKEEMLTKELALKEKSITELNSRLMTLNQDALRTKQQNKVLRKQLQTIVHQQHTPSEMLQLEYMQLKSRYMETLGKVLGKMEILKSSMKQINQEREEVEEKNALLQEALELMKQEYLELESKLNELNKSEHMVVEDIETKEVKVESEGTRSL